MVWRGHVQGPCDGVPGSLTLGDGGGPVGLRRAWRAAAGFGWVGRLGGCRRFLVACQPARRRDFVPWREARLARMMTTDDDHLSAVRRLRGPAVAGSSARR